MTDRKFDGKKELVRKKVKLMKKKYDEDSKKNNKQVGKKHKKNESLDMIRRIMFDIDDPRDLEFMKIHNENPKLRDKIFQFCTLSTS